MSYGACVGDAFSILLYLNTWQTKLFAYVGDLLTVFITVSIPKLMHQSSTIVMVPLRRHRLREQQTVGRTVSGRGFRDRGAPPPQKGRARKEHGARYMQSVQRTVQIA